MLWQAVPRSKSLLMSGFSLEGTVKAPASCCCGLNVVCPHRLTYQNITWSPPGAVMEGCRHLAFGSWSQRGGWGWGTDGGWA